MLSRWRLSFLTPILFLALALAVPHTSFADDKPTAVEPASGSTLPAGQGFRFYATTNQRNGFANQVVDFGHLTYAQLPTLFDDIGEVEGTELLPGADLEQELPEGAKKKIQPVEVVIVVPKGAPMEERLEMIKKVRASMAQLGVKKITYLISESFVDLKEDHAGMEDLREQLNALGERIDPKSLEGGILRLVDEQIEQGLEDNETFCKSWMGRLKDQACKLPRRVGRAAWALVPRPARATIEHPYSIVVAAKAVALAKFSIAYKVAITRYGWHPFNFPASLMAGGGQAAGGYASAAAAGGSGAWFGYNADAWSRTATDHMFPWFQNSRLVRWYNSNPQVKSTTLNFVRSLGIAYCIRSLAYYTGQTVPGLEGVRHLIGSPWTLAFLLNGFAFTMAEVIADGSIDTGRRAGQERKIYNVNGGSYAIWSYSFVCTLMHTLFRSGAETAAWAVAGGAFALSGTVWGVGKYGEAPPPRYYFISDGVETMATAGNQFPRGEPLLDFPPEPDENTVVPEGGNGNGKKKANIVVRTLRSIGNFLYYLSGYDAVRQRNQWKDNQFDVSDETMVRQNWALNAGVWNTALMPFGPADLTAAEKKALNARRNKPEDAKIPYLYPMERRFIQENRVHAFESDPSLKQADLNKWLSLGDSDMALKQSIWDLRMARLVNQNNYSPAQVCVRALMEAHLKDQGQDKPGI